MSERTKKVPVYTEPGKPVNTGQRAASIRNAVRNYTKRETVEIRATWNDSRKEWELTLIDED